MSGSWRLPIASPNNVLTSPLSADSDSDPSNVISFRSWESWTSEQLGVEERDDLGQERVGADELIQGVLEREEVFLRQRLEPLHGGVQRCVDGSVALGVGDGDQDGHRGVDLISAKHVEVVQAPARVPESVGVRGDGHRHAVPRLEGRGDVLGLVAEVEHERIGLQRVDAVQPGQRLHCS